MEQNTDKWLEWRRKGIGASDAPVIMGLSKFQTPIELFDIKLGRVVSDSAPNFIQAKGNRLEPIARAKYELMENIDMKPALCQHVEYEYMRASMDGLTENRKRGLEIKYLGKKLYNHI